MTAINYSARNYGGGVAVVDQFGPLKFQASDIVFDSSAMGPEYGTARNQNIVMGFHDANPVIYDNTNRIAIGNKAGNIGQGLLSIAIGHQAGEHSQNTSAVAVGAAAGQFDQHILAVAIGGGAGYTSQGDDSIAIGTFAGQSFQKKNSISIGNSAGKINQDEFSIAIGNEAGSSTQSSNSVAIGNGAGKINQSGNSIAVGFLAGNSGQKSDSIAIGNAAGISNQSEKSIAIGLQAGQLNQVSHSICIGYKSSIVTTDEVFSKNKISLCLSVREKDNNNTGGATAQHSFVFSTAESTTHLQGPLSDGQHIETPHTDNTAGDLASKYFNNSDNVGFLNVKINRGEEHFVGMMALFNLRKII